MRFGAVRNGSRPRNLIVRTVITVAVLIVLVVVSINWLSLGIIGVFAVMTFGAGVLIGEAGVIASLITVVLLGVRGELIDRNPLSVGHFLVAGAVAIVLYGVLGGLGWLLRQRIVKLASRRRANRGTVSS
jgi:hypothetical protein